jgi:flavin-dependent dehydrogenase
MPERVFDVAVIGAGPAGAATARRLACAGCDVLLIERSNFEAPRVGETLAPSVQPLLAELGLWDRFSAMQPLPSWGTRSFWGDAEAQSHSHLSSPWGCGWHIDRRAFDRMLSQAAAEAGAEFRPQTRLRDCASRSQHWDLAFDNQSGQMWRQRARVLVDASGRGARLAQRLGARRLVFDALVGVSTQFSGVCEADQGYTLVESSAEGWWYSAPAGGDTLMTMLMTDADLCGRADLAQRPAWQRRLDDTVATCARIGAAPMRWGPHAFSAASQRLQRNDPFARWLAVGDAALAVDPVSGSGVPRALRSACSAATAIVEMLQGRVEGPIAAYEETCDREFLTYLDERESCYAMEPRWMNEPFWQRRRGAAAAPR